MNGVAGVASARLITITALHASRFVMIGSALVALPTHTTILALLGRGYADFLNLMATVVGLPSNCCHDYLLGTVARRS